MLALVLVAAACSGDDPVAVDSPSEVAATEATPEQTASAEPEPAPSPSPTPEPPPPAPRPPAEALRGVRLAVEPFVDLPELTGMAWRADDPGLYLTSQGGVVSRVVDGQLQPEPVIDLTPEVTPLAPGSERGLLGIAFDPLDGRMFLHFTDQNSATGGDTHIVSYEVADGRAIPESRREVLFQEQPGLGHKGGQLVFDPAGNLFAAIGDGGGSNGRDAQDMTKILGSIIRITPRRDGPGYDVPADNPFVGQPDVRPEIWHKGLRNPWRFSIDHPTGDMWLGDVGNSQIEEINHVPAGQKGLNFGWYYFEGTKQHHSDAPAGMTPPVFEYPHSVGPAVIGGYVYRGSAIPGLAGAYLFADLGGTFWAMGADGTVELPLEVGGAVTSFGQGPDGELYVLTLNEGAFRLLLG